MDNLVNSQPFYPVHALFFLLGVVRSAGLLIEHVELRPPAFYSRDALKLQTNMCNSLASWLGLAICHVFFLKALVFASVAVIFTGQAIIFDWRCNSFILFVSATYVVYTLKLVSSSRACNDDIFPHRHSAALPIRQQINSTVEEGETKIWRSETTGLEHIVFSIAVSTKLWDKRKNYTKLRWKPEEKIR
nr:uncharacterized protein LOC109148236 [Ipomoea batatas]GME02159.1 uncharacterized protein LOC109148236 [Ipomoea batatas]GME18115.1 uncharacterized protein LOC109148236 [Ipomoea batatas]